MNFVFSLTVEVRDVVPLRCLTALLAILAVSPACADPFFFSTGNPDGLIATASRPDIAGRPEIESADDFVLTQTTHITGGYVHRPLTGGASLASIGQVVVEIYRVFPNDSDVGRTSGPPTFSTAQVPTRVNSPSDDAFATRSSTAAELMFIAAIRASVLHREQLGPQRDPPDARPVHRRRRRGDRPGGPVQRDLLDAARPARRPLLLRPAGPVDERRVLLALGAAADRPPGHAVPGRVTDLQSWIRNAALDPDWLRVGTDITHQGPFNAVFSLTGDTVAAVPEPETYALLLAGLGLLGFVARRRKS